MHPVGSRPRIEVDVQPFWMGGYIAVVGFAGVVILNQVIPSAPSPNNIAGGWPRPLYLDHSIGKHSSIGYRVRISAGSDGFLFGFSFLSKYEHVSIGQRLDVVMLMVVVV